MAGPSPGKTAHAVLILKDLLDRELHYLKCLQGLLILQPLRDAILVGSPILSQVDIDKIFSANLSNFLALSQALFFEILRVSEQAEKDTDTVKQVGAVFIEKGELFKCYLGYATQVNNQIPLVNDLIKKNARFIAFLKEKYGLLRSKNVHDDLVSLLVRPSRQMVLYLQFLEGLVKELGQVEPLAGGLAKLKEVLAYVGKSSPQQSPRKQEEETDLQKLQNVQKRLIGRINIVDLKRQLLLQEVLVVLGEKRKKEVHLILFNDSLLIAAPYEDRILLERFLPLDLVSVSELDGDNSGKAVLRLFVYGYEYTLLAPSLRSRYTWLTLIASRKDALAKEKGQAAQPAPAAHTLSAAQYAEDLVRETLIVTDFPRLVLQVISKYDPKTKAHVEVPGTHPVFTVGRQGALIGRDTDDSGQMTVILLDDENISRKKEGRPGHAKIDFDEVSGDFRLRDLGSANNTFIIETTGKVLKKLSPKEGDPSDPYTLKETTIFQMGSTRLKVVRIEVEEDFSAIDLSTPLSASSPNLKSSSSGSPLPSPKEPKEEVKSQSTRTRVETPPKPPVVSRSRSKAANIYKTVRASPMALGLMLEDDASAVSDLLVPAPRPVEEVAEPEPTTSAAQPEAPNSSRRESTTPSSPATPAVKSRILEVVVGEDVRGRVSVLPTMTLLNLREDIWNTMLEEGEKSKMKGPESVLLRVVGKVPLRSAQNAMLVTGLLTDTDSSVTVVV